MGGLIFHLGFCDTVRRLYLGAADHETAGNGEGFIDPVFDRAYVPELERVLGLRAVVHTVGFVWLLAGHPYLWVVVVRIRDQHLVQLPHVELPLRGIVFPVQLGEQHFRFVFAGETPLLLDQQRCAGLLRVRVFHADAVRDQRRDVLVHRRGHVLAARQLHVVPQPVVQRGADDLHDRRGPLLLFFCTYHAS